MLRRELVEKIKKVEEQAHLLASLVAILFLATFVLGHLATDKTSDLHEMLEILHWVSIAADVLIVALLVVVILFRQAFMGKDNASWDGVIDDETLSRQVEGLFSDQEPKGIAPVVKFCSEEDLDELSELNFNAFATGDFAIEESKLRRRNRSYAKRNSRIFMFIENPLKPGTHIGYSAMVPLTSEGMDSYLDGALKDANIPPSLIAVSRSEAAGVLLFAMHLKPEFSFAKHGASRDFTIYFLACVRHHAWSLFGPGETGSNSYPPVYIQTSERSLSRRVQRKFKFEKTDHWSGDGFQILILARPFRNADVAESDEFLWIDHWWQFLVILFGLLFVALLVTFSPRV